MIERGVEDGGWRAGIKNIKMQQKLKNLAFGMSI
jgi:hypothetical protein